jgi:uncharacterized protein YvpB
MKKYFLILIFILAVLISAGFVFAKIEIDSDKDGLSDREEQNVYNTNLNKADTDSDGYSDGEEINKGYSPLLGVEAKLTQVSLDVPYINEAPDDNWTGPWKNACEEASMAMVEKYYFGKSAVAVKEAKVFMTMLFTKQNNIWGSNADSDAKRTAQLINDYTIYNAKIIDNPTVEDIKKEIQQKRPVIALHYGFDLNNKDIPFVPLPRGTSYHMTVVVGYDDDTREFIVNDTGDRKDGKNHHYDYDLFVNSLHDFDFKVHKANGPARVIFTYPKFVKSSSSPKVYYLSNDTKQWIVDEATFNAKKWGWDAINLVDETWLDAFSIGIDMKI